MIPAIKAAVAISFINTALIILLVSFTSTLVSQAKTSPPLTPTSTLPASSSSPNLVPTTYPTPSTATSAPITSPPPTAIPISPTPDTRCLVQVRGQVFDVTQFKSVHSGGDIFQCGTDMTAVFNSQHNDSTFGTLQKYKI